MVDLASEKPALNTGEAHRLLKTIDQKTFTLLEDKTRAECSYFSGRVSSP
jgi:hypothetical protein